MADTDIKTFETWFTAELPNITGLSTALGSKIFNKTAGAGFPLPYLVFNVFPLADRHGQARTSIQTRLGIDVKLIAKLPFPDDLDAVIAEMDEHFRTSNTFQFANYRISIWRERPISMMERGATPDEKILSQGSFYRATMSKV